MLKSKKWFSDKYIPGLETNLYVTIETKPRQQSNQPTCYQYKRKNQYVNKYIIQTKRQNK